MFYSRSLEVPTLRMQLCPKKRITPTFLLFSDGTGTPKIPIPVRVVWILRAGTSKFLQRPLTHCFLLCQLCFMGACIFSEAPPKKSHIFLGMPCVSTHWRGQNTPANFNIPKNDGLEETYIYTYIYTMDPQNLHF